MTTYDDTMDHARPGTRFVAFGLAVLIGVGVLGARLFYLEGTNGARIVPPMTTRPTVVEALPSSRGLIYDRAGRPLVANVPAKVFAVVPMKRRVPAPPTFSPPFPVMELLTVRSVFASDTVMPPSVTV